MSESDAYEDDMERISSLSEREVDRLLAGKAPSDDGRLEELAAFAQDVGTVLQEPPAEDTAARHLAAITAAAQELSAAPERSGHVRFRSRRKPMRAKLLVASAGILLVLAFGSAAYAGALPGPVQGKVASLVGNLGVTLPGDDEGDQNDIDDGDVNNVDEGDEGDIDDGPMGDVDEGPVDDVDKGPVGDTDDGQQGDVEDGQQGDTDDGAQGDHDQGQQGDVDEGDEDQGQQEDADDGAQGDRDEGDQGGQDDGGQGGQGNND